MQNIRLSSFYIFLYLIVPTYLLSAGYSIYSFIYVFPISLFLIIIINLYKGKNSIKLPLSHWNLFFIFLAMLSFIYLISSNSDVDVSEFSHIFIGLIIIVITINIVNDKKKFESVIRVIKIVIFSQIIHAIYQLMLEQRVTGAYTNENRLTSFILFFTPFLLSELIVKKNTRTNISLLILVFIVVTVADSRINLIAFLLQISIFMLSKFRESNIKKKGLIGPIIILLIICTFPLMLNINSQILKDSHGNSFSEQYNNESSSINERVTMINAGFDQFKNNILFGVGPDNIDTTLRYENFHNFFIHIMASYGVFAILLFIIMYISIYYFYRKCKIYKTVYNNAIPLFLISFPLIAITPSYLMDFRPFYMVFALVFAYIYNFIKNIEKKKDNKQNQSLEKDVFYG